ncbi:MAG: adenylyltransferase/cytidyltransferase family protein [Candidatus Saccharimonadales bacterium]
MSRKKVVSIPDIAVVKQNSSNSAQRLIADFETLSEFLTLLRADNHKIVLTQGVYDLIHEGHAKYLEMAKSYGDILIVGIDSDELTRKRKGKSRPIVPEKERIEMLVHLRHVDLVFLRQLDHDIGDLIRAVKPDILVTSSSTGDFPDDLKKEYEEHCGQIVTLTPQSTTSTTARIRRLTIDGAEQLAEEIHTLTKQFIERIRNK